MNTVAGLTEEVHDPQSRSKNYAVAGSSPDQLSASRFPCAGISPSRPQSESHPSTLHVALLTGGGDKPYALGMAAALTSEAISIDFIGSDDLEVPELLTNPRVNFLNLRGSQQPDAGPFLKAKRVFKYYI